MSGIKGFSYFWRTSDSFQNVAWAEVACDLGSTLSFHSSVSKHLQSPTWLTIVTKSHKKLCFAFRCTRPLSALEAGVRWGPGASPSLIRGAKGSPEEAHQLFTDSKVSKVYGFWNCWVALGIGARQTCFPSFGLHSTGARGGSEVQTDPPQCLLWVHIFCKASARAPAFPVPPTRAAIPHKFAWLLGTAWCIIIASRGDRLLGKQSMRGGAEATGSVCVKCDFFFQSLVIWPNLGRFSQGRHRQFPSTKLKNLSPAPRLVKLFFPLK